jgi:hypothetical protein
LLGPCYGGPTYIATFEYGSKPKTAYIAADDYAEIHTITAVPLIINLRFTRTSAPIRLRPDFPLGQVQPLPREAYAEKTLSMADVTAEIAGLVGGDWADYATTIAGPNADPERGFGGYAVSVRKRSRRTCPSRTVACGSG